MAEIERAQEAYNKMSRCTYQVFLSFRGEDTRKNFTDHLYTALVEAGINTFRDDDEIERGENIMAELQKAIEESKISVVVFSKDYASSRWCLEELAMILERRNIGHIVLPVFYDVDPSQVRKQANSYAEAFVRHEKRFNEELDRVENWRAALREVSDLAGMALNESHESQFIQDIVKEIRKKLYRPVLNVSPHLVGMDSTVNNISTWLQDESNNISTATIYGIGGIGKTAIAKRVYNLNVERFQCHSFLANVRDASKEPNGLVRLQSQLLSNLLKGRTNGVNNEHEGMVKIKDVIRCKKVLIVVDDVDDLNQLDAVIGRREWLYPGSKIMVTTRHLLLFREHEACMKFKIRELNDNDSLHLFSWHAFGQDHPIDSFMECSRKAIQQCGGLPLAIEVLASSLSGRSINVWENALQKLQAIPQTKIQNVLKTSFDSLDDDHDKNLFLDIACFFIGKDKEFVVGILDGCGFYTTVGIQNLIDRCLLTVNVTNKIAMHQLLRDMGREIVRQESVDDPGQRSRLWHPSDSFTVLKEENGVEKVRGLALDMRRLMENEHGKTFVCASHAKKQRHEISLGKSMAEICWKQPCLSFDSFNPMSTTFANAFSLSNDTFLESKSFKKMHKLKLLQLNYVKLREKPQCFPKNLRWLCWQGFPLKSIPTNLSLEKLVALDMRYSCLKHAWGRTMFLPELKFLNLGHCHRLVRSPNFSGLPKLQRLIFKDSINLIKVDESMGDLERLVLLNFKGCKKLRELPKTLTKLKSLEEVNLSGCVQLTELPEDLGKMLSLKVLSAGGFPNLLLSKTRDSRLFNLLPTTLGYSTFWSWLSARNVHCLTSFPLVPLPCSISHLSLENCKLCDDAIPTIIGNLPSLYSFNLCGNPLHNIPKSINCLTTLGFLSLNGCTELQSIPELPTSMICLSVMDCTSLERVTNPPKSSYIHRCEKLVDFQGLFSVEPINNIDIAIAKSWGLSDLETLRSTEVDFYNTRTMTRRKISIQVLHECCIVNIFIPGNEIPSCFSLQSNESMLSFDVPPFVGHKIHALNLCVLCTLSKDPEKFSTGLRYAKISNKTKRMRWMYNPLCYAVPESKGKDMLWLSHWKLGDDLEIGDEIDVSVINGSDFEVKMWGMCFVYEPDDKAINSNTDQKIESKTSPWYQTLTHSGSRADACFVCHHNQAVSNLNLCKHTNNFSENVEFMEPDVVARMIQNCVLCDDACLKE